MTALLFIVYNVYYELNYIHMSIVIVLGTGILCRKLEKRQTSDCSELVFI